MSVVENRSSGVTEPNENIRDETRRGEHVSNLVLLRDSPIKRGVLLLGGTSVAHFRVRCAQSVMRRDLTPSFWSQAALLDGERVYTIPVDAIVDVSRVPFANGLHVQRIAELESAAAYPNIAVLRFTKELTAVLDSMKRVSPHRSQLDVPALIVTWLGYIWSTGGRNPLLDGVGVPSARWLESVFAGAFVEIAPGLASGASCPEAIWQAAKWWYEFYRESEGSRFGRKDTVTPEGWSVIRQPAAAPKGPTDTSVGAKIVPEAPPRSEFNPVGAAVQSRPSHDKRARRKGAPRARPAK